MSLSGTKCFRTKLKEYGNITSSFEEFFNSIDLTNPNSLALYLDVIGKVFSDLFQDEEFLNVILQDPRNVNWEQTKIVKIKIATKGMGHVDHGKTTLASALTFVSTLLMNHYKNNPKYAYCKELLESFKFKSVSDIHGGKESKERGVTINVTTLNVGLPVAVNIKGENVLLLVEMIQMDCPGHADYIKNAILGSGRPDMIIIICAADGANLQTSEHINICGTSGYLIDADKEIVKMVVFMNKCDQEGLEEFAEMAFEEVSQTVSKSIKKSNPSKKDCILTPKFVLGSAYQALNLKSNAKWITSIFELLYDVCENKMNHILLDSKNKVVSDNKKAYLYVENLCDVARGKVCTGVPQDGAFCEGDEVFLISPYMKEGKATIISMQQFHKECKAAYPGDNCGILLRGAKELYENDILVKGTFICKDRSLAVVLKEFIIQSVLFDSEDGGRKSTIAPGFRPQIYLETEAVTVTVKELKHPETGEILGFMQPGTPGIMTLSLDEGRCIVISKSRDSSNPQKITIRESSMTLGGGTIILENSIGQK